MAAAHYAIWFCWYGAETRDHGWSVVLQDVQKKQKRKKKEKKTTTLFKVKLITLLENSISDAFWNFNRKAEQPHFC